MRMHSVVPQDKYTAFWNLDRSPITGAKHTIYISAINVDDIIDGLYRLTGKAYDPLNIYGGAVIRCGLERDDVSTAKQRRIMNSDGAYDVTVIKRCGHTDTHDLAKLNAETKVDNKE